MKLIHRTIFGIIMAVAFACPAIAFDIEALDRVHVLMPKAKVRQLIGNPDQYVNMGNLELELYHLTSMGSMTGTACIYEGKERLAGQIFFFNGKSQGIVVERLIKNGYTLLEAKEDSASLTGNDDDTNQPLVAFVYQSTGMTMVMTFEKGFYERRVKQAEKEY